MWVYDQNSIDAQLKTADATVAAPAAHSESPVATTTNSVGDATTVAADEPAAAPISPLATEPAPQPVAQPIDTGHLSLGTWSYEVQTMAKAAGCVGDGAWLISPASAMPQDYRVVCHRGGSYTAVCDSLHCTQGH